ncbi:MAG: AraC family transcriptional regulator [Pseudomonadota bacterium]
MNSENETISSRELAHIEHTFGDQQGKNNSLESNTPLIKGEIRIYDCAFGATLCVSDTTALRSEIRTGSLAPGLWIVRVIGGRGKALFDRQHSINLVEGDAAIMLVHKDTEFCKELEPGLRFACLLMHASSKNMRNKAVADAIKTATVKTSLSVIKHVSELKVDPRLFSPNENDGLRQLIAESCAASMLSFGLEKNEIAPLTSQVFDQSISERMRSVRNYLHENPYDEYSLSSLARFAKLSSSAFKNQFRKTYGEPPITYIRNLRLDMAKAQLVERTLTIAEAAYKCGYEHPANFATAFKKRFGVAPRDLI